MGKIQFLAFIVIAGIISSCHNSDLRYKNSSLPVEERVKDLLSRMTLEEKAAQLDMLAANDILEDAATLSPERLKYYIDTLCIGAIHDLYPESAKLANEIQKRAVEHTRLGIPLLFIEEALHGYQGKGATTFPVPLATSCTWDTTMVYAIGRTIATETRAHGIHFVLAPNLDLGREIRWGRVEETYGEDTYLASRMGVNIVKGLQGENLSDNNAVIAEPKHFAMHGIPESGSNEGPVLIGERDARNSYLYVFEKAVREGNAKGIMAAYHELDGIPSVANKWLLTDVLRKEWGFDGIVVSDLGAVYRQITNHHTASTDKEAIVNAISAGLDMQFYDFKYEEFQKNIVEAVNEGLLAEKDLDRAVAGVLRLKFELGLFENPYTDVSLLEKVFNTPENKQLASEAARNSIVLLQNEGNVLPVDKNIKKITLVGNLANSTYTGGYSPAGAEAISVYEALRQQYGEKIRIEYINNEVSDRFSSIPPSALTAADGKEKTLSVNFYNNADPEGRPAYSGYDANLTPYWHNLSPAPGINSDNFSASWEGFLTVSISGLYEFYFRPDDYGKVFLNNQLLIDCWKTHAPQSEATGKMYLEAGKKIPFRVDFAEIDGNAGMTVKWRMADVSSSSLFSDLKRSLATSDFALVVMGETLEEVGESRDRHNLHPHEVDMDILRTVAASGKPFATVMITGRPLILTEVSRLSPAIVQAFFPGEATGTAITDVLFGDHNPSGKLTLSFPKAHGQLPVYYSKKKSSHRRYVDGNGQPLFPFGHGLSYTRFKYDQMKIAPVNPTVRDNITVTLDIENTGTVDGTEVIQLYINDKVSSVGTPEKELKGFAKVHLKAGEKKTVFMTLTPEHLSLLNKEMKRVVEPGEFDIMVGGSSADIRQTQTILISDR
ncbi:MAG: glycoside hydrolase family 3 C-terminal domain-containing protein [Candidatus Azobacteroides sp.]|nr:glycoside hydrolase family 3 C-terminal domain-containing protein [Candidatus Azobacteroides sp.]